jgi:hypothetical protein
MNILLVHNPGKFKDETMEKGSAILCDGPLPELMGRAGE